MSPFKHKLLLLCLIFFLLSLGPPVRAATYTVTILGDGGPGTLRQAILDANANPGADVIEFDTSLVGVINLSSNLPLINESLSIDGTTTDDVTPFAPEITINGTGEMFCLRFSAGSGYTVLGLSITGCTTGIDVSQPSSNVTLGGPGPRDGLNITGTATGILVDGADDVTILGSSIGPAGANTVGIYIRNSAENILIGGSDPDDRNIISGNTSYGIEMDSSQGVTVINNYIGVDDAGTAAVANGSDGIYVGGFMLDVTIGGADQSTDRNVISGNTGNGINISGSDGVLIENNFIGVDRDGTIAIPNGENGILIDSSDNQIGGDTSLGNLISGNTESGIRILGGLNAANEIYGNLIGVDMLGAEAIPNGAYGIYIEATATIVGDADDSSLRNVISGNTLDGVYIAGTTNVVVSNNIIGLGNDGVTEIENGGSGVLIDLSDSVTIGGITGTAGNTISSTLGQADVEVSGLGSDFNTIRKNKNTGDGEPIILNDASNEGLSSDDIEITTANTSEILGTSTQADGSIIDLYLDGNPYGNVLLSDGVWEFHSAFPLDGLVYATVTIASGSTSEESIEATILVDLTEPNPPVITSDISPTTQSSIFVSGTKDPYTSVISNGVEIVPLDSSETWSYTFDLDRGENEFVLSSEDYSDLLSIENTYTIIRQTGAGGTDSDEGDKNPNLPDENPDEDPDDPKNPDENPDDPQDYLGTCTADFIDFGNDTKTDPDNAENPDQEPDLPDSDPGQIEDDPILEDPIQEPLIEDLLFDPEWTDPTDPSIPVDAEIDPEQNIPPNATVDTNPSFDPAVWEELSASILINGLDETQIPQVLLDLHPGVDVYADEDGDGLLNGEELIFGTDLNNVDSDFDSINDFDELNDTKTSPIRWDSDGDGLSDLEDQDPLVYTPTELTEEEKLGYLEGNGLIVDDTDHLGTIDPDHDGLSNAQEIFWETNPCDPDSDDDGWLDGEEVLNYDTDPKISYQIEKTAISNFRDGESISRGQAFFLGTAPANTALEIYAISPEGFTLWLGATTSDETGKFALLGQPLSPGDYSIVVVNLDSNKNVQSISYPFKIKVVSQTLVELPRFLSVSWEDNGTPMINGVSDKGNIKLIATWQSLVLSNTIIIDNAGEAFKIEAPRELEQGPHTITIYAVDNANGNKSSAIQIPFSVGQVSFQEDFYEKPIWALALGLVGIALILTIWTGQKKKARKA